MTIEPLLKQEGIPYEKHLHASAYSAQQLANAEHVSGYMVAKPVIVRGAAGYAMCVVAAPKHLDLTRVADALHEQDVRLATEEEMARLFPNCELGAEPPIGPAFGMKTVMDAQLQEDEFLIMQAGTHHEAIKLRREDWQRVSEATVAPIAN